VRGVEFESRSHYRRAIVAHRFRPSHEKQPVAVALIWGIAQNCKRNLQGLMLRREVGDALREM
jgi:hypothetical protein